MNKTRKKIIFLLSSISVLMLFLITNSCSNDFDVLFPEWDNDLLSQTTALTADQKNKIEGIYSVVQGSDQFGSTVILRWTTKEQNYLTVCTGKNFGYFVMQGGMLDATVYVQGLWRYQNSAQTGLTQFKITQGADWVLNSTDSTSIIFTGTWGEDQGTPGNTVEFKFVRPIKSELLNNSYYIISHHGSGGGPEYLPYTENTSEICKIIERYGSNGIEVDVRISADGIPYMYHDNSLNPRLVQKGSLVGNSENYTYQELYSFVRLIHGEHIPTLENMLTTIVNETDLVFVYVDCKPSAVNNMAGIAQVCQDARDLAATIPGRNPIQIYMALTSDDVLNAFMQLPNFQDIPTICELTIDDLEEAGSDVWSPRFTQGTQNSEVQSLHSQGKQAICWTVNAPVFMQEFLFDGLFDGMLTDYPALLGYYYYGQ